MSDANGGPNTADTSDKSDRWTVRGIGADTRRKAADMADKADVTLGQWLSRLIERVADKATVADVQADDLALLLARLERLERAVFTADTADMSDIGATVTIALGTADTLTTEPPCPTRSPESGTGTPMEAAGLPAGAVDAGADDSTGVPGGAGAARKRLAGGAKAQRAADIKRTLNRALAE